MKKMKFDKKMLRFISWALIASTSLIILVSAISTVVSVTNKSTKIAMKEVEVMAANTEDNFRQYYGMIWALMLDRHIQGYLKDEGNQYQYLSDAYSVLDNACNMWSNINFISIIREDGEGHLIKGDAIPNWIMNYTDKLEQTREDGIHMSDNMMQMVFTRQYSMKGDYALNIYYPLYSSSVIGQKLGTLCINVNDSNLQQLLNGESMTGEFAINTYFVHSDGEIVVAADLEEIHQQFSGVILDEDQMIKATWRDVFIYKKLSGWNFYYVTQISWWELLKDSVWTVIGLGFMLALLIIVIIRMAKDMVIKAYEPWDKVVKAMGAVSEGELSTRLTVMEEDPDMWVVSKGFNGMMDQLNKLMEQIKEEEEQMHQIRLEALHSQIQPHFLYNTLDCIHWQAVVSGNKDISDLVKALAVYYRICLSKGKDVIKVGEELEYTRNYLYILRMRYGEMIEYEIISNGEAEKAVIPKLTLQPLVENAIYHGIKKADRQKGKIRIEVSGCDERILIKVIDNGAGMTAEKIAEINQMLTCYDQEFGYGVRNVNRRIQLFYGRQYGLNYQKNQVEGVTVTIELPYLTAIEGRQTAL